MADRPDRPVICHRERRKRRYIQHGLAKLTRKQERRRTSRSALDGQTREAKEALKLRQEILDDLGGEQNLTPAYE